MEIEIPTKEIKIDLVKQIETDIMKLLKMGEPQLKSLVVEGARKVIDASGVSTTGLLRKEFKVLDIKFFENTFIISLVNEATNVANKYYWHILETGRKTFKQSGYSSIKAFAPSPIDVKVWMDAKGGFSGINPFQMSFSIAKKGIKPRPEIIEKIREQAVKDVKKFIGV